MKGPYVFAYWLQVYQDPNMSTAEGLTHHVTAHTTLFQAYCGSLHLTFILYPLLWLLRNLYAGQEPTVRTGHGTTDGFQIGIGDSRPQVNQMRSLETRNTDGLGVVVTSPLLRLPSKPPSGFSVFTESPL